ncbi:Hsp70 family protein [Gordonia sp. i37]|uniref:Hsp70 family protein n=1 Tax=Gordonia sp. i37 TaxID=1961707 RepID=UPI0009ACF119|nr:Hsp70 family protein [Gordonia sp. i37]OPX16160.1 molecular chaperone [Gordonia sp. i37]
MGIDISSTFEINDQARSGDTTSLGVSVGEGMIHYVLLTHDEAGRTALEARVFDVDPTDGLDSVGRVNAGIDLMLDAARAAELRVGPIGVAARTATQRRRLRSGGSGTRRQIHLGSDEEAVAEFLTRTGQIGRFSSVVVADCGDTGVSLYTVDPAAGRVGTIERSTVLSGRRIDEALADHIAAEVDGADAGTRTKRQRAKLVSACRTAKEEVADPTSASGASTAGLGSSAGLAGVSLTSATVERVAGPMVDEAREVFARYLADLRLRGDAPDAAVLVGGLANLPVTRRIVPDAGLELLTPASPELAAATGAAMLAGKSGTNRLAFIGGRRARSWSAVPVAIVAGIIGAIVMAAVAVGATVTDDADPLPSPTRTADAHTIDTTRDSGFTTTSHHQTTSVVTSVAVSSPTSPDGHEQLPSWATTELPLTTSTTTLTLVPNTTTPSVTTPSTTTPTGPTLTPYPTLPIPSGLIPSGLIPSIVPPQTTAPGFAPEIRPSQPSSSTAQAPSAGNPAETTTTTPAR